ncbi:MAG TPA: GNAT family N-acetyltransferase [Candidatus Binataceae bacterium]|nr:GNAT family N-acetyltransferase [Candidatus Binataceae bacterium]
MRSPKSTKSRHAPSKASSRDGIEIRSARGSDFDALLRLIRAYYRFDHIAFVATTMRPALRAMMRDESLGRIWIADDRRRAAGYAILTYNWDIEFGGLQGILTDLYLRANYRGLGIGKRIIETVEKFCAKHGISTLELQVERDNKPAQAFYRSLGFSRLTRIVMTRDIPIRR